MDREISQAFLNKEGSRKKIRDGLKDNKCLAIQLKMIAYLYIHEIKG